MLYTLFIFLWLIQSQFGRCVCADLAFFLLHLKEDTALVLSQVQKDPTQGCPVKKTAMAANPHYYIACQPLVIFAVFVKTV